MENPKLTLRAARMNLGFTRKEASKLFGIHHETMANYEANSSKVPRSFFVKIPEIYGISVDKIYFGKEEDHYFELRNKLDLDLKQHA
jgi:transcriptional regulator with XRE-family HTH domain